MRDIFGRIFYGSNEEHAPLPYEIAAVTNGGTTVLYTRYDDKGALPCGIRRETTVVAAGAMVSYKCEFTMAVWADRAAAGTVYVPINEASSVS